MNWRLVRAVWFKELLEAVRDRRTLVSTLLIPTLIVPLLFIAAGLVMVKVVGKARAEKAKVLVLRGDQAPELMAFLEKKERFVWLAASENWRQLIAQKEARVVLELPVDFEARLLSDQVQDLRLYHYEGEMRSGIALGELRRFLNEYRDLKVIDRLGMKGLPPTWAKPFDLKVQNAAPPEKVGGNAVGGIVPYLFLLFCFSGCLYPAIDITAGEKERGTMETILSSPIGRIELVLGKFFTVLTASLATVLCSLVSMVATLAIGSSWFLSKPAPAAASLASSGALSFSIAPLGLVATIVLTIPTAAVMAALLLAVCLVARNTKEAQSYATPLMFLVILPAMLGSLPGIEMSYAFAWVPVLNVVLATKDLLSGVWNWGPLALVFASSCLFAAFALALCVRQFQSEKAIFRA